MIRHLHGACICMEGVLHQNLQFRHTQYKVSDQSQVAHNGTTS